MRKIEGLQCGMGIGGWLTNYKRFNVLPKDKRMDITVGDLEHFDTYITERDVAYIASLGMDHIRLGFDQIVLEEAPYVYRERIFSLLHNFVGWCKNYNLRVVFNMHKAIGNYCDILEEKGLMQDEELQNRFVALWVRIENEFADEPDIIFELLNEVVNATSEEWNAVAAKAISALRALNPTRIIVVGGTEWNNPPALPGVKIYDDENIIYTFHCYAPNEFTHQRGVLQWAPLYYNRKMPYPCEDIERYRDYYSAHGWQDPYAKYERMDIEYMRDYLAPAFDFVKQHPDKVLWCGEFGTIRHADIKWRENWMRDMITLLKEHDIPYCVWNYLSTPNDGNRFSLVDDDRREILSDELLRIIRGEV
jgi:hypothetical protein